MSWRLFLAVALSLAASTAGAQWRLLPGLATDVGVGPRGNAWVIGIEHVPGGFPIYRWAGSDWQIVIGGAVRIDVDPAGHPWVINADNAIFRWRGGEWERLPGLARDVGIGANGAVWVVGITPTEGGFTIHRWNGNDWDLVPGGAVRIDVDPRGVPWVVNDRTQIFRLASNGWEQLPGQATAVTISSDGTAWALGTDRVAGGYSVQRWTGKGWRRVSGGGVALSAGPVPWLVNADNRIFRWQGR